MAFTYDPTTDRGKVRLLLGDTVDAGHKFEDADIDAFLELEGGDVLLAAAQGYRSLAAKVARDGQVSIKHGPREDKFSARDLIALAEQLEERSREAPHEEVDSFEYVVDSWGGDHSQYVGDPLL